MTVSATPHGYSQNAAAAVEEKYEKERNTQLKARGKVADIEITLDEDFKRFAQDPWVDDAPSLDAIRDRLSKQRHHKVVIVGAGHGGLLFAVRLIQTGRFHAEDILLVDAAAGFGGTWYWNRYPGLMCDTESYIYMPLLEETGYMPRNKYASGAEIREHTERIAQRWGLTERAMFQTTVQSTHWDEQQKIWMVSGVHLGDTVDQTEFHISADFTILATGSFASPRVPDFPNILDYKGKLFHTARWDYGYTGGSPTNPELSKLADKKVAIIGAGASAVQIVPLLARYTGELLVCNRTPSTVDERNNRSTDPAWWKDEMSREGPGWQARRQANFNAFTCNENPLPSINKVADGWTEMPSFSLLIGGPQGPHPDYVDDMRAVDLVRQENIRARVHSIVRQPEAADLLTPWYPGWCKRPCFHDDYLLAFNQPNVRLLDLRHHGISHFTPKGFVVNGAEHEVDAVILSTGYTVPVTRNSPASRADMTVTGRDGLTMEDKWNGGLATLHGVMTRGLPNLFFAGTSQSGACVNLTYSLDQNAIHVAHILSSAAQKCPDKGLRVIIEPTSKGEEGWTAEVVSRAAGFRGIAGCTPGYLNGYGMGNPASLTVEEQLKGARLAAWGEGIASYVRQLETWRDTGRLDGLELSYVL